MIYMFFMNLIMKIGFIKPSNVVCLIFELRGFSLGSACHGEGRQTR